MAVMNKTLVALAAVALLAGCQMFREEGPRAVAELRPTKDSTASGMATFTQVGDKVRVHAVVSGLKPGQEHGFHVHEVGDCGSGDGMSTKGTSIPTASRTRISAPRSATRETCRRSRPTPAAAPNSPWNST
jgi:Cu/Zn superoxide dismutase